MDRSFNANSKRACEIVDYILKNYNQLPKGIQFHFEIAADILKEELLQLFIESPTGLFRLEIGLQSLNSTTLDAINRKTNLERLANNINRLTACEKLHVHLDLIAGLPFEGFNSLRESFNGVMKFKADVVQLGFLKLLPGSPMYDAPMGEFCKQAPYQVISTPWLSEQEFATLKKVENALDKLYNSKRFEKTLECITDFDENPFDFLLDYSKKVKLERGESHNAVAQKTLNYLLNRYNNEKIYEAMRQDMKTLNPVGRLPSFLTNIPQQN